MRIDRYKLINELMRQEMTQGKLAEEIERRLSTA